MNEVCINGKAVYSTGGAAKEYGTIACNLHNGCRGGCRYCYLKFGVWKKRLGGGEPVIQASFHDANHAYAVFSKEFRKYHKEIVEGGGVFFSFSTDPCDPSVFPLYYRCMMKTLGYNAMGETDKASPGPVTVTLLTKRSEWVDTPEGQMLLSKGGKNLRVGFTLTGHDEMERGASPGEERIKAMAAAFRQGCHTWVSLEPVLDDDAGKAKDLVLKTADFCCEYKVGLLSVPTRKVMGVHYDRDKIEEFGRWITNFCRDNHKLLYLKDSYTKLVEK